MVHLAYTRRTAEPLDHFFEESRNVDMAYNVLRCAYDAGARRVVVASSNHAADWYEYNLIHARKLDMLDPYTVPLSDNFYGWAKATTEHVGFLFACGVFGRKMGVVNVRIGGPRDLDVELSRGDPKAFKRDLGVYVSPRDLTQLFVKAIEVEDIDDEHGVPWHVVYGHKQQHAGLLVAGQRPARAGLRAGGRLGGQVRGRHSRLPGRRRRHGGPGPRRLGALAGWPDAPVPDGPGPKSPI